MSGSRIAAGLVALILMAANAADARGLTVRDLLRTQSFTRAFSSPDGSRIFVQIAGPLTTAGRYDDLDLVETARTRLGWIDPQARRPVLHALGQGLVALGWSPGGGRLALGRLVGRRLRLGVLDAESGHVTWSSAEVQAPATGPSVAWRSETDLLALAPLRRASGAFPDGLPGSDWLQRLRRRQAEGGLSGPVVHVSGPFARDAAATTRLLAVDIRRGADRTLATGTFDDLSLSTSGRYVALSGPAGPPDLATLPQISVSDPRPQRRLTVLDLQRDRPIPLPSVNKLDIAGTLLSWSPERDQLLVFGRTPGQGRWEAGRYAVLDARRDQATPVELGPAMRAAPDAVGAEAFPVVRGGWRGGRPVVRARLPGGTAGWFSDSGGGRLAASPAPDATLRRWEAAEVGQGVRGLVTAATPPSPAASMDRREPILRVGKAALEVVDDLHGVTRLSLRRPDGLHGLLTLNSHLHDVEAVQAQSLARTSRGGARVQDWLYLPPARTGSGPPPLVVVPYPGVTYATAPGSQAAGAGALSVSAQLLAAHGFAVLVPSLPRAAGEPPSAGLVEDVLAAVDGAARRGVIDPQRVAVWGHSFGGYAALVLATRTPRFRAVIAHAAPSDLLSHYGDFSAYVRARPDAVQLRDFGMGWSEAGQGGLGGPPGPLTLAYARESPAFHAEAVRTPILLIAGDQDFVDATQSEEMFSALRRFDKDVELLVFPGENHEMQSPPNYVALQRAGLRFLDRAFASPHPPEAVTVRTQVSMARSSITSP